MQYRIHAVRWLAVPVLALGVAIAVLGAYPVRTSADSASVSIAGFVFASTPISVTAGDTVTWTNNDAAVHDVTDTAGVWTSGVMNQGDSFSYTFTDPGTFTYLCKLHPWMKGSVIVAAPAS